MALEKAHLYELDQSFAKEKDGGRKVEVQFNPETLKVTFANQIVQPQGGDQAAGNAGRQFVGSGTTKLALQLWFDVTAMEKDAVDDVRRLTQHVVYFMTPQPSEQDPKKLAPPGVRFHWGSFLFDGMVEGMEETLEFFSQDGKPLRSSITMTLSQQKILAAEFKGEGKVPNQPGQAPLKSAKQGDSLQSMAGKNGKGDWQGIASANGIEDPLRMPAGQLVDLNLSAGASIGGGLSGGIGSGLDVGISGGASVGGSAGFGGGASIETSVGLNASLGGSASGSISFG
ncbi:LysM peptidoglycan-binding domain-containing protein [Lysobacter sp. Root690]|uniref:LysM peptidoglycan-binding domain-containing protein n=1 Tax=Lysobacter sp. Root690 TaxID=1736588 RepID=UPI000AA5059A|nr:LysM peptidoglycan-binding domain-containing protein [Lysobacter sp. Root690]